MASSGTSRDLVVAIFANGTQYEEWMVKSGPAATKVFTIDAEEMAGRRIAAYAKEMTQLKMLQGEYLKVASSAKAGSLEQVAAMNLAANATRRLGEETVKTSTMMRQMSQHAMTTGRSMSMYLTLPLIAIAAESGKMAIKFQQNMELIRTQAGATQQEVTTQTGNVLTYAKSGTSPQGPTELAQGLYHLESLGLRGAAALDALKTSSQAAGLGIANLETVATALGGAIVTGIRGTKNYNEAMGVVNATVGAGNMRLADYVSALSTGVLPTAKKAGMSLTEFGAALAVLTDRGMGAQMAATRLKMNISMLEDPTNAAKKALADLGIGSDTLATLVRSPNGFLKALELLKAAMDNMGTSAKDKTRALQDFMDAFGKGRSSSGMLTLVDSLTSGVSSFQGKLAQIKAQQYEFSQSVAAYHQTAAYKISAAWSSIKASMISVGNAIMPAIVAIAGTLKFLATTFTGLPGPVKNLIGIFAIMFATLGPILLIGGKITQAFLGLNAIMSKIGATTATSAATADAALATTEAETATLGTTAAATQLEIEGIGAAAVSGAAVADAAIGTVIAEEAAMGTAAVEAATVTGGAFAGMGTAALGLLGPLGKVIAAYLLIKSLSGKGTGWDLSQSTNDGMFVSAVYKGKYYSGLTGSPAGDVIDKMLAGLPITKSDIGVITNRGTSSETEGIPATPKQIADFNAAKALYGTTTNTGADVNTPGTFTNPIPSGTFARIDQGTDYISKKNVVAVGAGTITSITKGMAGGTGDIIKEKLAQPVNINGRIYTGVYYSEEKPLVKAGQHVAAGMDVMGPGGNELGFLDENGRMTPLVGGLGKGSKPTLAGSDFDAFVRSLGGVGGGGPVTQIPGVIDATNNPMLAAINKQLQAAARLGKQKTGLDLLPASMQNMYYLGHTDATTIAGKQAEVAADQKAYDLLVKKYGVNTKNTAVLKEEASLHRDILSITKSIATQQAADARAAKAAEKTAQQNVYSKYAYGIFGMSPDGTPSLGSFKIGVRSKLNEISKLMDEWHIPLSAAAKKSIGEVNRAMELPFIPPDVETKINAILKQIHDTITTRMGDITATMKQKAADLKTAASAIFTETFTAADAAFDDSLNKAVQKIQDANQTALDKLTIFVSGAGFKSFKYQDVTKTGARGMTPAEAEINKLQDQHGKTQMALQLINDRNAGDMAAVAEDLYQLRLYNLGKTATLERNAADSQLTRARKHLQDQQGDSLQHYQQQRKAAKMAMDVRLKDLLASLESHRITTDTFFTQVNKLFKQNNIDAKNLSVDTGTSLINGLTPAINKGIDLWNAYADAMNSALRGKKSGHVNVGHIANAGTSADSVFTQFPGLTQYKDLFAIKQGGSSPNGYGSESYYRGERDSFNPSKLAIRLFGNSNTASDVAGEMVSHFLARGIDPAMTKLYNKFKGTLTPEEITWMKADYKRGDGTTSFSKYERMSGIPALFRGSLFHQLDSGDVHYTPEQQRIFTQVAKLLHGGMSGSHSLVSKGHLHTGEIPPIHIHFHGPVIGTGLEKAGKELAPHVRKAIVRSQTKNVTSGIH